MLKKKKLGFFYFQIFFFYLCEFHENLGFFFFQSFFVKDRFEAFYQENNHNKCEKQHSPKERN